MLPAPAEPLFVFGTLRDADVLGEVLSIASATIRNGTAPVQMRTAMLFGHTACVLTGQNYPILRKEPDSELPGALVEGLTAEHWRRLVWFEGSCYDLACCRVSINEQRIDARVFTSENHDLTTGSRWRLNLWQQAHKDDYLVRARLWMRQLDAASPLSDDVVWNTPLDALQAQGLLTG